MAMALTDAIMVGRGVGTEALAAMALGLSFVNVPFIALYGFSSATSILTARAFGSGKTAELPVILRHGIFLSAASAVVVGAHGTLWFFNHLEWVKLPRQPPE
jgi:Na+-driven multidrug efflux pump